MSDDIKDQNSKSKDSLFKVFGKISQSSKVALPFLSRIDQLEKEVELLTEYSSDTVYRLRYSDMGYEYISPAVRKLLGYTPNELRAISFRSLIHETKMITEGMRKVHSFDQLEDKRKKGDVEKWHADYLIERKDGKKIWVSDSSIPWVNEEGDVIGAIGCLRDVTDRIYAEDQVKEELVRLAHTDSLTSLANRRAFFNKIEDELRRIKRSGNTFSILLIDIDYFKKVNDTFGHDVGDRVLQEIAQMIRVCLRETDLPARIGGEEFGVFLPDTPAEGGYYVAERICKHIAKHKFSVQDEGEEPISCTVSIGIASTNPEEKMSSTDLYKLADTRLYIAKHTGRNQVSVDEVLQVH